MSGVETAECVAIAEALDLPWNVVVHDDPVNLMGYVTLVLMRVFGYPKPRAEAMMMSVHRTGRAVVWSGARERAEHYARELQAAQLKSTIEKSS